MLAEFRKLLRECGFHEIGISYRQGVLHLQRSLSPRRGFGSSQEAVALFDQALARGRRGLRLEPQPPRLAAGALTAPSPIPEFTNPLTGTPPCEPWGSLASGVSRSSSPVIPTRAN